MSRFLRRGGQGFFESGWSGGWLIHAGVGRAVWLWVVADESFRGAGVGGGQHLGADRVDGVGLSVVDVVRGVPGDSGMPVFGVVPGEEAAAEGAGVLDAAEAGWEVGPVLQGPELGLAVRI